jgi:predicted metal-dependent hydrolase
MKKVLRKNILLSGSSIEYLIRKNRRAKRMKLAVYCDGRVVATVPRWLDVPFLERIIQQKAGWIIEKIEKFKKNGKHNRLFTGNRKDYKARKEEARKLVAEKIKYFNNFYNLRFNKISIRNQHTRWGSCSKNGNLNFNYRIIYLPGHLADYLIVHELCHLQEFNHSRKFWELVEKTIPDSKERERALKK